MVQAAALFPLDVERGPDWLFIRLNSSSSDALEASLADEVWRQLERHFTYRVVLELDDLPRLTSRLIGQLVMLQKRIHLHQGVLRICGLNDGCSAALHACRLDQQMVNYRNREDAVLSRLPVKPR